MGEHFSTSILLVPEKKLHRYLLETYIKKKTKVTLSGYCSHWADAHCQLTVEAIWNLWLEAPGASERSVQFPERDFRVALGGQASS